MRRKFGTDENSIDNILLVQSEVRAILNSNFRGVYENRESFNFRCNVCGDSKESEFKKRGHIYKTDIPWTFHCYNCGAHYGNVLYWIKEWFPYNYDELKVSMRRHAAPTEKTYDNIQTEKEGDSEECEADIVKTFKKATNYDFVVKYCTDRKIPFEIYSKWFYAEEGKFANRMIIPFYNKKGTVYYYQGRAMDDWMIPKYKSRKGSKRISIYGYYTVDRTRPVVILEGPIDSIFVENAIGVTGLKVKDPRLEEFPSKYFLLDNDKDARKVCVKLLNEKQYVFSWNKFLSDHKYTGTIKDVNDFVLNNLDGITSFTWELIEPYFTNRPIDKILFKG
jgi:hypothetical protein